ncbi:MAG: ATP-binding cassette domain-containing protein [Myxococcota bacterium]
MITFENVRLQLGDFTWGPVDFEIARGQYCLVTGPSGAGKSLLLEIIAGFRHPDTGCLRLRNQDVTQWPPERRGCAWVPQSHALFEHMSVRQNIEYGLRCRGVPAPERRQQVKRWAERLGIASLVERSTHNLSGGECQRVAIARALVTGCDILLLDEPFASLDRDRRQGLGDIVEELQRELDLTVVHVTHHEHEVSAGSHRLATMHNGKVQIKEVGLDSVISRQTSSIEV